MGPTKRPAATGSRAARYITGHYFGTNLGLFGLLSTLAVALTASGFSGPQTGFLVLVFTVTNKTAKVLLARWLDRLPVAAVVLLGCLAAAAGFVGLRVTAGLAPTALTLALAGLGVSVNALASKQLAADASDRTGNPARLFSLINIAVNIASATAAPVALFVVSRGGHDVVLTSVAIVYSLAGVLTFLNYSRLRSDRRLTGAAQDGYLALLRLPGMRPFLLINFFGWVCYGQLFNSLALYVSGTLHAPDRLGWLYTLNALAIVVAQLGVTNLAQRWAPDRPAATAVVAYGTFTLSFTALALLPGYLGAAVAVLVFTVAEMMFVPTMDVLLLGILGEHSRAVGYGIFSISNALGEALGGAIGVAAFRWFADGGHDREFWLVLAGTALTFTVISQWLRLTTPALRADRVRETA